MARSYKRDANGRFASGGGGGGGGKGKGKGKAAASAAKPGPRAGQIARASQRAKQNLKRGEGEVMYAPRPGGSSARTVRRAQSALNRYRDSASGPAGRTPKASGKKASKPAAKAPAAKMGKAAPNKAKAAYKAATSKAREAKMLAGGRTSSKGLGKRQDVGAQRIRASVKAVQAAQSKVRAMEKKRGVSGRKRKG